MKLKFASLFVLLLAFCSFVTPAHAWYGAGVTPGWDNAYDGLMGMVTNSVSAPPASYTVNTSIPLNFRITNPSGNPTVSDKSVYLKVFRVLHSPLSQNLGNPATVDSISMTEDSLFTNNKNGDDAQMSYQTVSVGTINVFGGQSEDFSTSVSINTAGYYQYDLTDLSAESAFVPGHIYAAGFLRIINEPSSTNGGGGGPGDGLSDGKSDGRSDGLSSGGNGGTDGQVAGAFTFFGEPVLGAATDSGNIDTATPAGTVEGITTTINPNCPLCRWSIPMILLTLIVTLIYGLFMQNRTSFGKTLLVGMFIPVLAHIIFVLINRICVHPTKLLEWIILDLPQWYCRYFLFVAGAIYLAILAGLGRFYQPEKGSK